MILIDGKKIQKKILKDVKTEVAELKFQPIFCDILVGEDPVSMQYVKMKAKMAKEVGMIFHGAFFPADITPEELLKEIYILNNVPGMCGIIVQLPLPLNLDKRAVLDAIDPRLDVDCLGKMAGEKFYAGNTEIGFPTALACMTALDSVGMDLANKKIVVLGTGELVGRPVAALLKFRNLEPVALNSETENKKEFIKNADVIISGIGKGKYINGNMIKEGVILIDAGTSEDGSALVGDVELNSVSSLASYLSPVPGGVGPVTVAILLRNVLTVAKSFQN